MNWDDLKYFFAVAEHGTISGAATKLRVNHTTVARRLAAMEEAHQTKFFNKTNTGYQLTAAGEALADTSKLVADAVGTAKRVIAAHETALAGKLVVTAPTALVLNVLGDIVSSFAQARPEIEISLISDDGLASLPRHEADVAIRVADAPGENLVGRKLAKFNNTLYANAALLERYEATPLPWISVEADRAQSSSRFQGVDFEKLPRCTVAGKSEALAMAEAGVGAAVLPCRLGDASGKLVRVKGSPVLTGADIWLLYHHDLRKNPRVLAFSEFAFGAFASQKAAFEGSALSHS